MQSDGLHIGNDLVLVTAFDIDGTLHNQQVDFG